MAAGVGAGGYTLGTPPQIGDQSWPILQFLFTTQHLQSTIGLNEVEMKLLVCTNTKPKQIHIMVLAYWFYQAFNCNPGYIQPLLGRQPSLLPIRQFPCSQVHIAETQINSCKIISPDQLQLYSYHTFASLQIILILIL